MPKVSTPATLVKVYEKAKKKIEAGEIPTALIHRGQVLYRKISRHEKLSVPRPAAGGYVAKALANNLLVPPKLEYAQENRYSGPSLDASIPP